MSWIWWTGLIKKLLVFWNKQTNRIKVISIRETETYHQDVCMSWCNTERCIFNRFKHIISCYWSINRETVMWKCLNLPADFCLHHSTRVIRAERASSQEPSSSSQRRLNKIIWGRCSIGTDSSQQGCKDSHNLCFFFFILLFSLFKCKSKRSSNPNESLTFKKQS